MGRTMTYRGSEPPGMLGATYVSIDPGSVHNGWANWEMDGSKWRCTEAIEVTKEQLEDWVIDNVGGLNYPMTVRQIAIEGFWLKPGTDALRQAGSSFGMVEVIGVVRALCRRASIPLLVATPMDRNATQKRLKAAGYRWTAYGNGDHAARAEETWITARKLRVSDLSQLANKEVAYGDFE